MSVDSLLFPQEIFLQKNNVINKNGESNTEQLLSMPIAADRLNNSRYFCDNPVDRCDYRNVYGSANISDDFPGLATAMDCENHNRL